MYLISERETINGEKKPLKNKIKIENKMTKHSRVLHLFVSPLNHTCPGPKTI